MVNQAVAGLRGRADLKALAENAQERLKEVIFPEIQQLFVAFLEDTQRTLHRPSTGGQSASEERKKQELARSLKQNAPDWISRFVNEIRQRLVDRNDRDQSDRDAEDERATIVLVSVAKAMLLAETQYFKQVAEIDARINRIHLLIDLPFESKALAPTGLHQALLRTAEAMKWPAANRDLLFGCFERSFVPKLDGLYARVITVLRDIGKQASELVVDIPLQQPEEERPENRKSKDEWLQPPKETLNVDNDTTFMLTKLALESEGEGYTDGLLAADLLALIDKRPLPGIAKEQGWVPVQRTSLAGHFFNDVKADPMVPKDQREHAELMRMPLIKSAIADHTVFTDPSHPLASLIDEQMTKAARHRLQNVEESEKMIESLQQTLAMFDLAPDFVRESMSTEKPLEDGQIRRFYALQRQQAAQRREFVINEAKRVVADEIERSCFGRDVPAPAMRFFNRVWGTLMTQRLLKHGASDARWNEAVAMLDELIDLLETRDGNQAPPAEWVELVKKMGDELIKGGLPQDQRNKVLMMLEAARKSP